MDGEAKMRELEEELKLLKAEVKSVLLDLREVMLARANPLVHGLPSQEAEDGEVGEVRQNGGSEVASSVPPTPHTPSTPHKKEGDELHQESTGAPVHQGSMVGPAHHVSWDGGVGGDIVAWVLKAMQQLGPQRVEHLLAMYRLLKPLPPNVERALAHLQELVRSSPEAMPSWLVALRELDQLASPS